MKIKCILCDLDETLLDDNKNIPKNNVESIKKLKNKNIKFVCATGRHYSGISNILKELDLYNQENEYIISLNGGLIVECKNHRILHSSVFFGLKAIEIVKFALKHHLCVELYTNHQIYIYNLNDDERARVYKSKLKFIEVLDEDISYLYNEDVLKIALESNDYEYLLSLKDDVNKIIDDSIQYTFSSNRYMEFNSRFASKGNALLKLCEILNIDVSESMAIGDHLNDESMLRVAGVSVAVNNAQKEIKEICDIVTCADNNKGAVSEIIEKVLGGCKDE